MKCIDCCQLILIVILPPMAVSIEKGACSRPMIVNLILTLLFFIPGLKYISFRWPKHFVQESFMLHW